MGTGPVHKKIEWQRRLRLGKEVLEIKGGEMTKRTESSVCLFLVGIFALTVHINGCATRGQTGALAGSGVGALVGQAIGHNTEATLIGGAVGTGVGYIIGNEVDKKKAERMSLADQSGNYSHQEVGPLAGTSWKVVDISPPGSPIAPFVSKIVEFDHAGHVKTRTTFSDGTIEIHEEQYRVVENILIVNRSGYMINAKYRIYGTHGSSTMDLYAQDFHAALVQIQ